MDEQDLDIPAYASQHLRSRRVDPATRRIALFAAGLAALVIVVALVWSGVHTGLGPPPVIKPPPGPMRTVPENPGGLQVPGANEQIMSGATATGAPTLAPSAQPPDLGRLQQDMERDQAARAPAHPPASATPPASRGNASPALPAPPRMPAVAAATAPKPNPAPAPPAPAPAFASAHGPEVQLAALNSAKAANQAWETLNARMPNLLSGHTPIIRTATVRGRKFWRLRVGGFADAAAAKAFCAKVKSEGAACEIAGF